MFIENYPGVCFGNVAASATRLGELYSLNDVSVEPDKLVHKVYRDKPAVVMKILLPDESLKKKEY